MANPNGRRVLITLAAITCGIAVAACGSSKSSSTAAASGQFAQGVKYSDCMRSQGVSNFPDPSPGGGFNIRGLGAEPNSPAFASAQTACAKLQPGGTPPRITGAQLEKMAAKVYPPARLSELSGPGAGFRRRGRRGQPPGRLESGGAGGHKSEKGVRARRDRDPRRWRRLVWSCRLTSPRTRPYGPQLRVSYNWRPMSTTRPM